MFNENHRMRVLSVTNEWNENQTKILIFLLNGAVVTTTTHEKNFKYKMALTSADDWTHLLNEGFIPD